MPPFSRTERRRVAPALIAAGALLIAIAGVMAVSVTEADASVTGTASTPVSDGLVTPYVIDGENPGGNRSCAEAAAANSEVSSYEFGSSDDLVGSKGPFTLSHDGTYVTWSADPDDYANLAIIVKGGSEANVYSYDSPLTGDSGLASPDESGLSNLVFCWNAPDEVDEPADLEITVCWLLGDNAGNTETMSISELVGEENVDYTLDLEACDQDVAGANTVEITVCWLLGDNAGNTETMSISELVGEENVDYTLDLEACEEDVAGAAVAACVFDDGEYYVVDDMTEVELNAAYGAENVWLEGTAGFDDCEAVELPNTGPGQLLAALMGGTGLLLMGSGSLVAAGRARRRNDDE